MDKREKMERARQEDAVLHKVLYWIVGAVVLEFLLLLVNRFYVNYTVELVEVARGIRSALGVLSVVFPICFVAALVWTARCRKQGASLRLPLFLTVLSAALAVCCIITCLFLGSGVRFLYIAVPVVTVLALVYYLYQHEFFLVAALCTLGILGVWLCPRSANHPVVVYGYFVVLAAILVAVVVLSRVLDSRGGVLPLGGKEVRVLPKGANYLMFYVTCAIVAIAVIAGILLGGHVALYGVLAAWLLVSAVYYTVKLM